MSLLTKHQTYNQMLNDYQQNRLDAIKDDILPQRQRSSHNEMVSSHNIINPIVARWATHKLENNCITEVLTGVRALNPTRCLILGAWHWGEDPPEHLAVNVSGAGAPHNCVKQTLHSWTEHTGLRVHWVSGQSKDSARI